MTPTPESDAAKFYLDDEFPVKHHGTFVVPLHVAQGLERSRDANHMAGVKLIRELNEANATITELSDALASAMIEANRK